jgi:hypothetical protein
MIEVFRTNIDNYSQALHLKDVIEDRLGITVNFDLDDCDRILRTQSEDPISPSAVIALVQENGFAAEVLPDEVPGPTITVSAC